MDPVGIIQTTTSIARLILTFDFAHASNSARQLRQELITLHGLLRVMADLTDDADGQLQTMLQDTLYSLANIIKTLLERNYRKDKGKALTALGKAKWNLNIEENEEHPCPP